MQACCFMTSAPCGQGQLQQLPALMGRLHRIATRLHRPVALPGASAGGDQPQGKASSRKSVVVCLASLCLEMCPACCCLVNSRALALSAQPQALRQPHAAAGAQAPHTGAMQQHSCVMCLCTSRGCHVRQAWARCIKSEAARQVPEVLGLAGASMEREKRGVCQRCWGGITRMRWMLESPSGGGGGSVVVVLQGLQGGGGIAGDLVALVVVHPASLHSGCSCKCWWLSGAHSDLQTSARGAHTCSQFRAQLWSMHGRACRPDRAACSSYAPARTGRAAAGSAARSTGCWRQG